MIDYVLEDNLLTLKDPSDRYTRVVNVQYRSESDLAEAISRRNIGISKTEAIGFIFKNE